MLPANVGPVKGTDWVVKYIILSLILNVDIPVLFLIKNISFVIVVVPDIIVINSVLADLIKNKFPIGLTLAVILPDDILSPLTDKLVKPLPSPENDPLKVPDRGYCICELLINAISY